MTVSNPLSGRLSRKVTRAVQDFPRDKDDLFVQPDGLTQDVALQIEHNRERMANKWEYADEFTGNAKTYDVTGNYNCGGCNQADGAKCLLVYGGEDAKGKYLPLVINRDYGSCGKYEIICAGDPELRASRIPHEVANYGVRKGGSPGHVFGCHECPFAKPTKWEDSRKRPYWCGLGASTVMHNACCTLNGADVVDEDES